MAAQEPAPENPAPENPASEQIASEPAQKTARTRPANGGSHRREVTPTSKLRGRLTLAAAVLLIVAAVAGTVFALVRHGSPVATQAGPAEHRLVRGTDSGAGAKAITGLSAAAIVRAQAARWIAKEVDASAIIACDDVMCSELFNEGLAASNLIVLSPTAPDPLGADIVVGTPALRSQFGQRLAKEYAPLVLASFGTGKSRVDVRAVALDGAEAYDVAFGRDLSVRQRYGGALLRNGRIGIFGAARPDLIAGLVDPRLLMMLPVLASQHPIEILGFYDRAPRSAQGVPLSGVELAGNDTAAGLSGASYLRWLVVFLRGQRTPYRPTSVTTTLVHGHEVVRVRFARPSPIGILIGQ
jgi:hypothetical protein